MARVVPSVLACVWLKIAKRTSGKASVTYAEALEVAPPPGMRRTGWLIAGIEHDRVDDGDHSAFGMREDKMPERVDHAPNDLGIR